MDEKRAVVFDIQRFSLNDGPGIRTVVFLKGCPLNCLWCHNPESKSARPVVLLYANRCLGCGDCVSACPHGLHTFSADGLHTIDRAHCQLCGSCKDICTGALSLCGREMTVDEILDEVMKDEPFYRNSGGGVTLSGGEPLMQGQFALALLKAAKEKGLHTAIETSGYAKWDVVNAVADYTDVFLWDVKETDSDRHKAYTGVDNALILDNLHRLSERGAKVVLRCPVIPGYNDREEHFANIGRLAETLAAVDHVDVEPYHPLGQSKADAMGQEYPLRSLASPEKETVDEYCVAISRHTSKKVARS